MNSHKRWTEKEEKYLFSMISENQGNLEVAFTLAGKKLGRTPKSCSGHWYSVMKNKEEYAFCFVTVGSKTVINNGKNTSNTINNQKIKKSVFKKVISIIKHIFK